MIRLSANCVPSEAWNGTASMLAPSNLAFNRRTRWAARVSRAAHEVEFDEAQAPGGVLGLMVIGSAF